MIALLFMVAGVLTFALAALIYDQLENTPIYMIMVFIGGMLIGCSFVQWAG